MDFQSTFRASSNSRNTANLIDHFFSKKGRCHSHSGPFVCSDSRGIGFTDALLRADVPKARQVWLGSQGGLDGLVYLFFFHRFRFCMRIKIVADHHVDTGHNKQGENRTDTQARGNNQTKIKPADRTRT